mmetsp:Transcript_43523/g.87306  ORF Transcript_43523/g.87306 Transcript_43523/m.87306 type:complete len:264 (+) Transcript_43523:170-961(+)
MQFGLLASLVISVSESAMSQVSVAPASVHATLSSHAMTFVQQPALNTAFHRGVRPLTSRRKGISSSQKKVAATINSPNRLWTPPPSGIEEADMAIVKEQLGYKPYNALRVAARGPGGEPAVLECYPLVPSNQPPGCAPFPTLFWLCSKELKTLVAQLEYDGLMQVFKERAVAQGLDGAMHDAHTAYRNHRWSLLTEADRAIVERGGQGWLERLRDGGVGGMQEEAKLGVKCLHTHLAHHLARRGDGNVFGRWVEEELQQDGKL